MNIKKEQLVKEILLGKCWSFFNDNFHKFSNNNKIKIGLALCCKDFPQGPIVDQSQHFVVFRNPKALQEEKKDNVVEVKPRFKESDVELPAG